MAAGFLRMDHLLAAYTLQAALTVGIVARREIPGRRRRKRSTGATRRSIDDQRRPTLANASLAMARHELGIDQNFGFGIALVAALCARLHRRDMARIDNQRTSRPYRGRDHSREAVDVLVQLTYAAVTSYFDFADRIDRAGHAGRRRHRLNEGI